MQTLPQPPKTDADYLFAKRHEALHICASNKRYHQECAAAFESRDRLAKVASIIGASATFATMATPALAQGFALFTFAASVSSLVFRWSEKARLANEKYSQYAALVSEIDRTGERGFTETQINDWRARYGSITEPAPNHTLWNRVCHETASALGTPYDAPLSWWQRNRPALMLP